MEHGIVACWVEDWEEGCTVGTVEVEGAGPVEGHNVAHGGHLA